jgi:hypothetical protein
VISRAADQVPGYEWRLPKVKRETFLKTKGDRSMEKSTKPADKKSARRDQERIGVSVPEVFESTLIEKVIC